MSNVSRQMIDAHLTEAQFRAMVKGVAERLGWLVYYIPDSRMASCPGYPDLTMYHPERVHLGVIQWELKVGKNKPTYPQKMWIAALAVNNPHARVVRPEDWQYITQTLQAV